MGTRSLSNGQLRITVQGSITNTLSDATVASQTIGGQILNQSLTGGTGANMANRGWQSVGRVLASGADEIIDLYDFGVLDIGAGAGRDGLGQACAFEEIVALVIYQSAGPGRLEINSSVPHDPVAWFGAQTVANGGALKAGGLRVFIETDTDGLDIQDGVSNKLKFTANGGAVTYSIYVLAKHDDDESSASTASSVSTLSSQSSSSTASSFSISASFSSASSASTASSLSSSESTGSSLSGSSASSTA